MIQSIVQIKEENSSHVKIFRSSILHCVLSKSCGSLFHEIAIL
jgi:hypothetical protein